ncbi:hypothetical protein COO60DRAFT_502646 [Scenedesmus sp. NREL 46B-D3]|nr:hypothetical protein COO60DRAFT_502646 [Scenedesmus sp. NREL 46B-D3]
MRATGVAAAATGLAWLRLESPHLQVAARYSRKLPCCCLLTVAAAAAAAAAAGAACLRACCCAMYHVQRPGSQTHSPSDAVDHHQCHGSNNAWNVLQEQADKQVGHGCAGCSNLGTHSYTSSHHCIKHEPCRTSIACCTHDMCWHVSGLRAVAHVDMLQLTHAAGDGSLILGSSTWSKGILCDVHTTASTQNHQPAPNSAPDAMGPYDLACKQPRLRSVTEAFAGSSMTTNTGCVARSRPTVQGLSS